MRRAGVVAALALLCACTGGRGTTEATPGGGSPSPASPHSSAPGPSGDGTKAPSDPQQSDPGSTEPLVVISHPTRPRLRLTLRRARRLVAARDPEVPPGRVRRRVLRRPGRTGVVPASAVDARVRTAVVGGVDPLREPEDYPLRTEADSAPPRPVTVTVAGDLMLTRGVADPARALAPMTPRLRRADLTVANLESTLDRSGPPQQGSDSFGADPSLVPLLERAGFDALSLANNHTGDFGDRALLETVRVLRRSRIVPFGAGPDLAAAARPAVLEAGGTTFGFLGFNAIGETPRATPDQPGALSVRMPPRTGPLARSDLTTVLDAVRRLDREVDVVVVLPHWGTQYTHEPEPVQRQVGRALVRAGADLVVGGHPHWVQGWEWHRGRLLVHSLGNFVFDMDFMTQTQQGVLLEATFWDGRLMGLEPVPYRMDAAFAPRVARGAEGREILGDLWASSTGPFAPR